MKTMDVNLIAFLLYKREYPTEVTTISEGRGGTSFHEATYEDSWALREYVRMYDGYRDTSELPARRFAEWRTQAKEYLKKNATGV